MPLDLTQPEDRKKARKELIWGDHGFLRYRFSNLHEIGGGMWRANQPSPEQLESYAARGFKTILNLRGPSEKGYYHLEKEACAKLGLTLIDYRVYSRDTPKKAAIHDLKKIYAEMEYPTLMHCKSGADRTGLAGVLFAHFQLGKSIKESMEQLRFKYLHVRHGKTGMIDYFFEDYIRYQDGGGALSFIDWVDDIYDPADVKARFMSGWIGNTLTDKILRRE
ncbi:fused DSP-PTPase phosphatase/NAD kinase-like protein [Robiginitomaculum antarcticum]|uniref:fused DSP-PTPase phosphatase/NAD kinase-like protein n=1 Tax=Robiginitomaculum antarcticum TaxID=437507 RepID=UPI000374F28E|nr:sulfur transferase domain-containing protein [Robiginitomaculum antarcticum]